MTSFWSMFQNASAFNQNIGSWNTAKVTDMTAMFQNATSFNQNVGAWSTGLVTSMWAMFNNAAAFNQNLGSWNVGNLTSAGGSMLTGSGINAPNYNALLAGWGGQTVKPNVTLDAGGRSYTSAASAGGDSNRLSYNWTITGDSLVTAGTAVTDNATAWKLVELPMERPERIQPEMCLPMILVQAPER